MSQSSHEKVVITGAPLVGEGNVVDSKSFIAVLMKAGIRGISIYPNGPFVKLGKWFHTGMTMCTKKTMDYAKNSKTARNSLKTKPLKWELKRAIKRAYKCHPHAMCFITAQSMMAEESVGTIGDVPTVMSSSDSYGKLTPDSKPSDRQREIIYLVWNREALDLYKNVLKLHHVHLIAPVDSKDAFEHIERAALPFQEALDEPGICYIKLSGSGGDPQLINGALISLWEKSRIRSIVFPGTEKTEKMLIKMVGKNVRVRSNLSAAVFYNQTREMISNEQMLLTYPSEQVKHIAVLTQKNIYPKVVWLPPRGQHEVMNMAWAIKQGFSGTICIPEEYQNHLKGRLIRLGVPPLDIEFVVPEKLSAGHFKPSPQWMRPSEAAPPEDIVRKVSNDC